jgi:hypothetical protein
MAFRRTNDETPGGPRWRLKHRAELIRYGIPDAILASDRSLNYVLLHGDDAVGTGWESSWLSPAQAKAMLAFLQRHFPNSTGYELIRILQDRVAQDE